MNRGKEEGQGNAQSVSPIAEAVEERIDPPHLEDAGSKEGAPATEDEGHPAPGGDAGPASQEPVVSPVPAPPVALGGRGIVVPRDALEQGMGSTVI